MGGVHSMQVEVRGQHSWVQSLLHGVGSGDPVRKQGLEVSAFACRALLLNSAPRPALNFHFRKKTATG